MESASGSNQRTGQPAGADTEQQDKGRLATVEEEAPPLSNLALCCHLAKFPRNPVVGDEFISRPRSLGSGGASLPAFQELILNESSGQQSLERVGAIPPNTRFWAM